MSKQVNVNRVLYYCDGVQVFDATDAIGGHYIGLLVEETPDGGQLYLVVGVSPQNLHRLRTGEADLRPLIENRAEQDWFTIEAAGGFDQPLTLISQCGPIRDAYLPDAGFMLRAANPISPVTLVGQLRKVDVDAGTWRLRIAENHRDYTGKVRGGVSLSHLQTDGTYRFICEEEIEGATAAGHEITTLYLTAFTDAHDAARQAS